MPKAKKNKPSSKPITIKLSLLDNAYGFLNQSLRHYRKASRNSNEWPFALLHLTQSLELLLKQVLSSVHPLLIYEDIDHPKHTVSLEQALARMEALKIKVEEKERVNIRRASDIAIELYILNLNSIDSNVRTFTLSYSSSSISFTASTCQRNFMTTLQTKTGLLKPS